MSALKNAKYEKTAKEYQDLFDTLLCRVIISQEDAINLYLGGLRTELEMNVKMFKPATLADAYSLTKLQEAVLNVVKKRISHQDLLLAIGQLFSLVLVPRDEDCFEDCIDDEEENRNSMVGQHMVHILVDCGSTYNFLDKNMAKKLGCSIRPTIPLAVTVADGNNLVTTSECYHQIKMNEADVAKTAFRTHEGHYKKFTLVFFYDILIYSQCLEEHVRHLKIILETMRTHKLFAKLSKYVRGTTQVEYLGHVIFAQGVATNPAKIEAMVKWHVPTSLKQLRGFLGLTGYYRRFIKGFAMISRPLTWLLKKGAYEWNSAAQSAFRALKQAMISASVLKFPDFTKEFTIETYASGGGIGAVLLQEGESKVDLVDKTLREREAAVEALKFHISRAQSKMKSHADKGRIDKKFDCGDWLRKCRHPSPDKASGTMPPCDPNRVFLVEPLAILDREMAKKGNGMEMYVLVQWTNGIVEDAIWESVTELQSKFPTFDCTA
nr:hypothetical protein [Tanacetum cinerariifolium]